MSLSHALHRYTWFQRRMSLPSNHHLRQRAKLYMYPAVWLPQSMVDLFDQPIIGYIGFIVWMALFLVNVVLWVLFHKFFLWLGIPVLVFMSITVLTISMPNAVGTFFSRLRHYLGVDSLEAVIKLSPSQFDDLCIKRLYALASELEEVEKRTQPFEKERLDARNKFGDAFDFFKDQGFVKGDWNRFFTQSKTQK